MNACYAYCLANTFTFAELITTLDDHYHLEKYRDVIHLKKNTSEIYIFQYGVIVAWNISYDELQAFLLELKPFQNESLATPIIDEFTFSTGGDNFRIHSDHITCQTTENMEKIAVSHGIAQSVKLADLEQSAQNTIDDTAYIPRSIAKEGVTHLSRRDISRMRGGLYLVKSNIHLNFDLLDTPEFFWEYPELQDIYITTANYLEVTQRIDILNKKLDIIHELFTMLSDEQKHKHSSTLEWIIIWLIAIEIVFFLVHDIFKLI